MFTVWQLALPGAGQAETTATSGHGVQDLVLEIRSVQGILILS